MADQPNPMAGPPWRVLLADDDASFRRMLRILLEDSPTFEVVGEAGDGAEAVELAIALQPHTVILDMTMPVMDGDSALALIKTSCPHTDVIALSADAWESKKGPPPDAALEKGTGAWMDKLPTLIELLAMDRTLPASS
ncbi:MAG TPA: response regulator transcription factor [Acidimicrobiales bacterium]|nr:response regulator transcription factor [Acidimicrobiales bacterium]